MSTEKEINGNNKRKGMKKLFNILHREENKNKNKNPYTKLIVLILLALGGGSLYYLMKKPSKKPLLFLSSLL